EIGPDDRSVSEWVRIVWVAVVSGAQQQIPAGRLGVRDDIVDGCGEDSSLLGLVEHAQLGGIPGIDRIVGDEPTGDRVDGSDEGGADLLGRSGVAVVEEPLLGLLDEIGCGTDGEGGRDDLTGPQRSGAVGGSLGQALREDFGEAVGLAGAGRGGDDVDAHEWSPAMPKMMLKGLKVCG